MTQKFDVFLSHNSSDMPGVVKLAEALQTRGLRPWLDIWELTPGISLQEELEELVGIIETVPAAAVLVGYDGIGPWQDPMMHAYLEMFFVRRKAPVVPVLLPGAPKKPELPLFLSAFTWLDLRAGFSDEGLDRLVWGVTGRKPPGPPYTKTPKATGEPTFHNLLFDSTGDLLQGRDDALGQPEAEFGTAPTLHEKVLEAIRRALGDEYPDTLASMNNFAITGRSRDAPSAREQHEKVLEVSIRREVRRHVLVDEHPDTLTSMKSLAATLGDLGDAPGARELLEEDMEEVRRGVLEPTTPELPLDPICLAYRLVRARRAEPELLVHFSARMLREAAARLSPKTSGMAQLLHAEKILEKEQEGLEPHPLWLAWMENVEAETRRRLMRELAE